MAVSQNTMDRIFRATRKVEKLELTPTYTPSDVVLNEEVFVLITGPKKGSFYPGTISFRNNNYPSDDPTVTKFIDATYYDSSQVVYVEAINDEPLLTGKRYLGKFTSWYLDTDLIAGFAVYTVVYTPPVGYGYGSGVIPDKPPISSGTWTGQYDMSASGCTITKIRATYMLIDDDNIGGIIITVTPDAGTAIPLGPFPVHGTVSVVIPGQTGTVSGTAGTCAISATVSVPGQTVDATLEGNTACP